MWGVYCKHYFIKEHVACVHVKAIPFLSNNVNK